MEYDKTGNFKFREIELTQKMWRRCKQQSNGKPTENEKDCWKSELERYTVGGGGRGLTQNGKRKKREREKHSKITGDAIYMC